ncbi:MAG: TetR/AcrR family transcriptional regulator [Vicinamibacterales bacterium]
MKKVPRRPPGRRTASPRTLVTAPGTRRRTTHRPYHHGDLRAALVASAARLAAERGPAFVSLREVARRADVSQAAPYHYFADKADLLAAVAEEGFRAFDAHQAAALEAASADPFDRLAALGVSYVRFAFDLPHFFRVMFRPHQFDPSRYPAVADVSARAFGRLVDTVRRARLAAGHDDADPIVAAWLVWALPHGIAHLYLDGPGASAPLDPRGIEAPLRAAAEAVVRTELSRATSLD